ncbi:phosphoribosylaminoimidazole carboxylase, ATPase subunit [Synechococcus sp. JA-3-3Ab]|nr:phosphoribosylaminoimidazole carboxylase, ATPase subunit [Synechococcus sp. JA-3-3Ab]
MGVIGGGQLAQMLALAARPLGIPLIVQAAAPTDPAVAVADGVVWGAVTDTQATAQLLQRCPVVTFENEFIPLAELQKLDPQGSRFRPRLSTLEPLLDKLHQRQFLAELGLPVPAFWPAETADLSSLSFPLVLKRRRQGYDGQGTRILPDPATLQQALAEYAGIPLLVEEWIPFERELAVMVARGLTGEIQIYPVVETVQVNQVCRHVLVPARIPSSVEAEIRDLAVKVMEKLDAVGVFAIELFWVPPPHPKAGIWINEISPRVHNSGHYTLEACHTSQFEQHLRAILGLPLGDPSLKCGGAVMVNLLGYEHSTSDYAEKRQRLAQLPNATVHWYHKTPARPGRKLGHVTVCLPTAPSPFEAAALVRTLESLWYPQP